MITIVFGDDITASRNFYIDFRSKLKDYQVFEGKDFDYNKLVQTFEGNSLFEDEKNIFIENFFSNTKSNSSEFKKIIDYINKNSDLGVFFWESKTLTKIQSGSIKKADIKEFSYPKILFTFLDSIKPSNLSSINLFHELQKTMETELVFYMMVRQFRLLLSCLEEGKEKIEEAKRLAPWQISKLKLQAKAFGKEKLISLYKKLYLIDYKTKYGLTPLSLKANIDIFLSDL